VRPVGSESSSGSRRMLASEPATVTTASPPLAVDETPVVSRRC
jgi:hypothetical protein